MVKVNWLRGGLLIWCVLNVPAATLWILSYLVHISLTVSVGCMLLLLPGSLAAAKVRDIAWPALDTGWHYAVAWPIASVAINLVVYVAVAWLIGRSLQSSHRSVERPVE